MGNYFIDHFKSLLLIYVFLIHTQVFTSSGLVSPEEFKYYSTGTNKLWWPDTFGSSRHLATRMEVTVVDAPVSPKPLALWHEEERLLWTKR